MDFFEFLILIFSGIITVKFFKSWYKPILKAWPPENRKATKFVLGCLPVASLIIILYTLKVLASFDVVDNFIYIVFYVLIGYTWLYYALKLMFFYFDISWIDDVLNLNNKAALYTVIGGYLGLTIIYSGANIGDGPGWRCVIFAGGLGLVSWTLLALAINYFTRVFERITVERDICCGIRFGAYLFASGIILGRASSGDWTSFYMTIVEFMIGWPVLPLAVLIIIIERYYMLKMKDGIKENYLTGSLLWCIIYIAIAIVSITFLPLN